MRILFLGINYWPEETGIAPFTTGRAEYLASRGHDVTVATAFPYYPQWRIRDGYRQRLFSREVHNGVTILRCPLYVPHRVSSISRLFHEASFMASSLTRAFFNRRPDLLFVTSPPLGLAVCAIILSRLWRIPYVFHVEDLQPDAACELGMLPTGILTKGLYALERIAYAQASMVSTLTEPMRARILDKGVRADKVMLISDWAQPGFFDVPLGSNGTGFRRDFNLGDRFLVVHAGNMGVKQGLGVILEAARLTERERPEISYLLVGDGAMRQSLATRIQSLRMSNLRLLPLLPESHFYAMLSAADTCLVTQLRSVRDIVFPSKVRALLASGRPIIASISRGSDVARVLEESGAGITLTPEDPRALADAVIALKQDPLKRRLMAEHGRAYAWEHWERGHILAATESHLMALTTTGAIRRRAASPV